MAAVAPVLSFIIPFYASHDNLAACIQSVAEHCSLPYEVLVLDDGNKGYDYGPVADVRHVRIITGSENCGPSIRRNQGIEAARGIYVQFLDSDDTIIGDPADYFDQARRAGTERPDVITGLLEGGGLFPRLAQGLPRSTNLAQDLPLVKLGVFTAHLYRRNFLSAHKIEFPADLRGGEDTVFLMRVWGKAASVVLTDLAYYRYRQVDNSLTKPNGPKLPSVLPGRSFEHRFKVGVGYMMAALEDFPSAKLVRGSISIKYGIKGLQRILSRNDKAAFSAAVCVLAQLIEQAGILKTEADTIRQQAGVYWDDGLQEIVTQLSAMQLDTLSALLSGKDIRLF